MIVKAATRDVAGATHALDHEAWTYLDRIVKVRTYGYVRVDGDDPNSRRISCTRDELLRYVEGAWGVDREFVDELWPEFSGPEEQRTVTCVRLERDDGEAILVLLDAETYLLSDDGKTVDRLR